MRAMSRSRDARSSHCENNIQLDLRWRRLPFWTGFVGGKNPFPGGESRSSGIPGAVARNGAPLSSPRLRQTSPAGLVFSQSRSANAEVEAMTAMMHRAALTAVKLIHRLSCERTQEQGCASMRMLVADRRTVSAFHGMSVQPAVCGGQSPVSAKPSVSRSTWRRPVRVKHHLNNGRDFEPHGDRWSERGAPHPGAAPDRFHPE